MAGLAAERDTPKRHDDYPFVYLQKTNTKIYNGGMVNADATGYAVPAADTASHHCLGRANATRDTTATGPDLLLADGVTGTIQGVGVEVGVGAFEYDNPANSGNQLTQADVGKLCYVLSDHEVTRAAGTANSIIAGVVLSVDVTNTKAVVDFRRKSV